MKKEKNWQSFHFLPDKHVLFLCVDEWKDGIPSGRILNACFMDEVSFIGFGDLLLTIPDNRAQDGALMLVEYKGQRMVRKLLKMDGMRIQMQAFDREFEAVIAPQPEVRVMGRCVKLLRKI